MNINPLKRIAVAAALLAGVVWLSPGATSAINTGLAARRRGLNI